MTNADAWWFTLALISGLLVVILPTTLMLMGAGATGLLGASLRAGAGGWVVATLIALLLALLAPFGPFGAAGGRPADDAGVVASVLAGLGVMLAATGAASITLLRGTGAMAADQTRGTVAVLAGVWCLVAVVFAWLALA